MATKIYYERFPSGGKTDYWMEDSFEEAFPHIYIGDGELEELGLGNISIDEFIADTEGD